MKTARMLLCAAGLSIASVAQADPRDLWMFAQWAGDHQTRPFREMLVEARLYGVVPIHQLLRSASDWRQCRASPFAVPPAAQWPAVRSTLAL
ncbi:peptidase M15, partial [Pseudomonas shirazensis]